MTNDERSTNSRNRNYSPDRGIEYSLQRAVLPWGEARGRECIQGDTRPTEQRSPRAKRPLPEGLRRFWLVASLFVGSQSPAAMLPSSRLATSQNRQQQTVFYPTVWGVVAIVAISRRKCAIELN